MVWRYKVVDKREDNSNQNIVATVQFEDTAVPGVVTERQIFGYDLTNAIIEDWARDVIATLTTRKTNIGAITLNVAKQPAALRDAKRNLRLAEQAFADALQEAQIKALANSELDTAWEVLKAARTAAGVARA